MAFLWISKSSKYSKYTHVSMKSISSRIVKQDFCKTEIVKVVPVYCWFVFPVPVFHGFVHVICK